VEQAQVAQCRARVEHMGQLAALATCSSTSSAGGGAGGGGTSTRRCMHACS
jgi:hypothetical protein